MEKRKGSMMGSETVSFLPNYLICKDEDSAYIVRGILYGGLEGGIGFDDVSQLLLKIDNTMDAICRQ